MKKSTKIAVSMAIFGVLAMTAIVAYPGNNAKAAGIDGISRAAHGNVSRLGELLVLDGLFANDFNSIDNRIDGPSRLGELIVLDGLFGFGNGLNGNGTRNVSRLGELLVLDGLFGNSIDGVTGSRIGGASRLGELLVLDGLFGFGNGFIR